MKLKSKDIPFMRNDIAMSQDGLCWLCKVSLNTVVACLDHDHQSGRLRGVLCSNCNGIEGKIFNLCRRAKRNKNEPEFLNSILEYWKCFAENPRETLHPNHKTKDEKRLARNKKARLRRKKI